MSKISETFASPAWLLHGITGTSSGRLSLTGDVLSYREERKLIFTTRLRHVERMVFPWYYFGGGVKLRIGGKWYRLSFVVPNGEEVAVGRAHGEAGSPKALLFAWDKLQDVSEGRALGREWRELLEQGRSGAKGPK